MRLALFRAVLPGCAMLLLIGCEPRQLYMVNHTVIGINAAVNPEQTTGSVVLGYDRSFATIIPRSVPSSSNTQEHDAMSALACSSLSVDGITIRRYTESLATGDAAIAFADHLQGKITDTADDKTLRKVKDFFDCFKEKPPAGDGQ